VVRDVARADIDFERTSADVDLVLDAVPRSVTVARHAVRAALSPAAAPAEVIEDVLLLVSELVTNAILHAGTDVRLSAMVAPGRVLVAVSDDDPAHAPHRPDRGQMATSGRGIGLVDLLSSAWGVEIGPRSKVVWFEATYRPDQIDLRSLG
jgi:anti-sigma regulatory factor (Ser/Thr protein kinase)